MERTLALASHIKNVWNAAMSKFFVLLNILLLFYISCSFNINPICSCNKKDEVIFYDVVYKNCFIISRLKDRNSIAPVPYYEYKAKYFIFDKNDYEIVWEETIGFGIDIHIMKGLFTEKKEKRFDTNGCISKKNEYFIWVDGQSTSAYMLRAEEKEMYILFENSGGRPSYDCQDIDGDGIYEILEYDLAWHAISDDLEKWSYKIRNDLDTIRIIHRYDGRKYYISDVEVVVEWKNNE
jgi:hypothetical protein